MGDGGGGSSLKRKIDSVREILGYGDVTVERTEEIVYGRSAFKWG